MWLTKCVSFSKKDDDDNALVSDHHQIVQSLNMLIPWRWWAWALSSKKYVHYIQNPLPFQIKSSFPVPLNLIHLSKLPLTGLAYKTKPKLLHCNAIPKKPRVHSNSNPSPFIFPLCVSDGFSFVLCTTQHRITHYIRNYASKDFSSGMKNKAERNTNGWIRTNTKD